MTLCEASKHCRKILPSIQFSDNAKIDKQYSSDQTISPMLEDTGRLLNFSKVSLYLHLQYCSNPSIYDQSQCLDLLGNRTNSDCTTKVLLWLVHDIHRSVTCTAHNTAAHCRLTKGLPWDLKEDFVGQYWMTWGQSILPTDPYQAVITSTRCDLCYSIGSVKINFNNNSRIPKQLECTFLTSSSGCRYASINSQ